MKEKQGRPRKYDYDQLTEDLIEYTKNTEIPIVAEFCYEKGILRQYLYEIAENHPPLSDAIKGCIQRKEVVLEKGTLLGSYDKTMAIFSLKQLGWKDKQEIEHSGEMTTKQEVKHDLSKLSTDELKQFMQLLNKTEGE